MALIGEISIDKKLLGGFAFLIIIAAWIGGVTYHGLSGVQLKLDDFTQYTLPTCAALDSLDIAVLEMSDGRTMALKGYAMKLEYAIDANITPAEVHESEVYIAAGEAYFDERATTARSALAKLEGIHHSEHLHMESEVDAQHVPMVGFDPLLEQISLQYEQLYLAGKALFVADKAENADLQSIDDARAIYDIQYAQLRNSIASAKAIVEKRKAGTTANIIADVSNVLIVSSLSSVIIVLFGALFAYLLSKNVIDVLSEASEQISVSAQQLYSSADTVSNGAQQIAITTQQIAKGASHQLEMAQSGGEVAKQMVEVFKVINEKITISSASVQELGENTRKIGDITKIINGIAEQTNMLALNAAIEAARAGEQGKGFAVVADEVRKLAEQSAKASETITKLVANIQSRTDIVVTGIKGTADAIESGSPALHNVFSTVDEIVSVAEQTAAGAEELAAASEEQSAAMEEITSSAEQLTSLSSQLRALISRGGAQNAAAKETASEGEEEPDDADFKGKLEDAKKKSQSKSAKKPKKRRKE